MKLIPALCVLSWLIAVPLPAEEGDAMRFNYGEGSGSDNFTLTSPAAKVAPSDIDLIFQSMGKAKSSDTHPDDIYVFKAGKRARFEDSPSTVFEIPERYYGPIAAPARENYTQPSMLTPPPTFFPDPSSINSLGGESTFGITESRW